MSQFPSLKSVCVVRLQTVLGKLHIYIHIIGVATRGAEGARAPPTFLASTHVYIIHLLQPRAALALCPPKI